MSPFLPPEECFDPEAIVTFQVDDPKPQRFLPFFIGGVGMALPAPCTVQAFFKDTLKLDDAFIATHLKTVFLDNHPVDDFTTAVIGPGGDLSLSGPMPGLVGAIMRAGGSLSGLRYAISYDADRDGACTASGPFLVGVRLFNILTDSLAGPVLDAGFYAPLGKILDFLSRQPADYREAIHVTGPCAAGPFAACTYADLEADPADLAAVRRTAPAPA